MTSQGILYLVATPIGNLRDISLRALEVLQQVAVIAAEDTRHSKRLLNHYDIHTQLLPLHAHNEAAQVQTIKARVEAGEDVALISDAGTPLISDPGWRLVHALKEDGFNVQAVPGACALIGALISSGLPTEHFYFHGFLSSKTAARQQSLQQLSVRSETIILYEAPHRLMKLLTDIVNVMGAERTICVARELTKRFETVITAAAADVLQHFTKHKDQVKGECVVMLSGAPWVQTYSDQKLTQLLQPLLSVCPLKTAVRVIVELTGEKKKRVYALALAKNG